jgi:hypothetical protein
MYRLRLLQYDMAIASRYSKLDKNLLPHTIVAPHSISDGDTSLVAMESKTKYQVGHCTSQLRCHFG